VNRPHGKENTPRLVIDGAQRTVWRWDQQEPFGNNAANEDPDGNSIAFSFPQRFPGQYYDAKTLLTTFATKCQVSRGALRIRVANDILCRTLLSIALP
jgi:hypothetical protein